MRLGILCLLFCVGLAACETATVPQENSSGPQPGPTTTPVPTSLPGMGTVKGVLTDIVGGKPVSERQVLLAFIHLGDQLSVAALDPNTPLKVDTDAGGTFIITNVPPGKYALAMFIPTGYVLINEEGSKHERVITVAAGESVDLGQVVVDPVVRMP